MPPNEECPHCRFVVQDWHVEWYGTDVPRLYQGKAAMDCPVCGGAVSFQKGQIGMATASTPILRRHADKAADWAQVGASFAGGTLQGYTSTIGPGNQYATYWRLQEIVQADADQAAKNKGP
jgi:hypothetical protein